MRTANPARLGEVLLLLPRRPQTALVLGEHARWSMMLAHQDVRPAKDCPDLCIGGHGQAKAASRAGAAMVLIQGSDPLLRLRHSGYQVRRYLLVLRADDPGLVVPWGRPGAARRVLSSLLPTPWLARPVSALLQVVAAVLPGRLLLTVGAQGPLVPYVLADAGVEIRAARSAWLRLPQEPRRRKVLGLIAAPGQRVVVKVSSDPDAHIRAERERVALARVPAPLAHLVPRQLAIGEVDGMYYAVETERGGVPLSQYLARAAWHGHRRALRLLDDLAEWLTDLAVRTRSEMGGAGAGNRMRFPRVLVHGDLSSGDNILVDAEALSVLDWETAGDGPPLRDLLPLLTLSLARLRGLVDARAQADYTLAVCRGDDERSPWLFGHVAAHLRALGVPLSAAGALARAAWWAERDLYRQHDLLLQHAGLPPRRWSAAGEVVAGRWAADPALGDYWPALTPRPTARPREAHPCGS
jgi:hypothetical protein